MPRKDVMIKKTDLGEQNNDQNPIYLPRQYTIKTRKCLIFKDFLGSLQAIYYPFTTFENLKN